MVTEDRRRLCEMSKHRALFAPRRPRSWAITFMQCSTHGSTRRLTVSSSVDGGANYHAICTEIYGTDALTAELLGHRSVLSSRAFSFTYFAPGRSRISLSSSAGTSAKVYLLLRKAPEGAREMVATSRSFWRKTHPRGTGLSVYSSEMRKGALHVLYCTM